MTDQDLKDLGFEPKLCKIDILYFRGPFFCRLDKETGDVKVYANSDDINPIGTTNSKKGVCELQKLYYYNVIEAIEASKIGYIKMIEYLDEEIKKYEKD